MATLSVIRKDQTPQMAGAAPTQPVQTSPAGTLVLQQTAQTPQNHANRRMVQASDYEHYNHREHVYYKSGMYIGSDQQTPRDARILDLSDPNKPKFIGSTITLPEGVERLFLEVISNAGDNVQRSREANIAIDKIEVVMDNKVISVRNGGMPIPVEIHPTKGIYVGEMIFGNLLTSSSYTGERTGAGTNGLGVKLCNIYSKKFSLIIGDSIRGKKYTQSWSDNMTVRGEPIIEDNYTGESFTQVIYEMDFPRFAYTEYPPETFGLYARHAADVAFTCKVPVTFNNIPLDVQDVYTYSSWMFDKVPNMITHYEWPPGTETQGKRCGQSIVQVAKDPNVVPAIELTIIDTPDSGSFMAYINGMATQDGGTHVEASYRAVSNSVLEVVNNSRMSGNDKKNKGKSKKFTLTVADVRRHITIITSWRMADPDWVGQHKSKIGNKNLSVKIPEKALKPVLKWDLLSRLYAELEAKQFKAMSRSDGRKRRHVNIPKAEDANFAGRGAKAQDCTLYVTEGKSAMGYAVKMISLVQNGRNHVGVYPMKGKPLNVMNADLTQITDNTEISELKDMLGLREGLDYSLDENFNTLRYGHLVILADSDDDGKHIVGLILNIFHCRYPTLLARGFIKFLRTPILRVWKGAEKHKFYMQGEYETWKEQQPDISKWEHKYFKGLGSSKDSDIREDFSDPRVVVCVYDDTAPAFFALAFNEKLAEERKQWIERHKPMLNIETIQMMPISMFINYEMIDHSISNLGRSIPGFDGLKKSQRKIIWGSFIKWGAKIGQGGAKGPKEVKVARFASSIADATGYHHGERSLVEAINAMALEHVGTNNLPAFTQDGQFGTRNMDGADAADGRYTFTKPRFWWPYIFRKEDHEIKNHRPYLTMAKDEGKETEPIVLLPILPIGLINGCSGIGTGHSTFIPNHDPLDLCNWIRARILQSDGDPLPIIIPWYRGFDGTIELKERQRNVKIEEGDVIPGIDDDDDALADDLKDFDDEENTLDQTTTETRLSVITTGVFEVRGREVHVTELPVGRSMHKYNRWLETLREEKLIADFSNLSTHDKAHFIITGMKNPSYRNLRLQRSFGMTNMVLLDMNDKPKKFNSAPNLLENWYQWRLPYYQARRQFMIDEITEKIANKNTKIRFIRAIVDFKDKGAILGVTIDALNKKKSDIYPQMDALQLPHDLLNRTNFANCTEDEINHLQGEIVTLTKDRQSIIDTPAEQLWINDINEFEQVYCRHYHCQPKRPVFTLDDVVPDTPTLQIINGSSHHAQHEPIQQMAHNPLINPNATDLIENTQQPVVIKVASVVGSTQTTPTLQLRVSPKRSTQPALTMLIKKDQPTATPLQLPLHQKHQTPVLVPLPQVSTQNNQIVLPLTS